MLQALENIPKTPDDWSRFSWDHRDSHNRIRAAIKMQYSVSLDDYQIDPVNPDDFQIFLENNSQLHGDMNGVLRLQSSDLEDVNMQDPAQAVAWFRLHYLEHYYAETALKI
jgi:hypothetical protein